VYIEIKSWKNYIKRLYFGKIILKDYTLEKLY